VTPRSHISRAVYRWDRQAKRIESRGLLLFVAISIVYWVFTLALARRKLMWNDELYTYYIALLPSMHDVWAALKAGGEQTPPLFYIITRASLALAGVNEIAMRLPEMIAFWAMSGCLFVLVWRRGSGWSASCAAALPLVTSAYYYSFEARPYGLVLGFGAAALLCWQTIALGRRGRLAALIGLALSLAAAGSSHYYGVFLILPIALGEAARTAIRRRIDAAVWAALGLSTLPLAFELPLIKASRAYSGTFWSPPQWLMVPDFYQDLLAPAVLPTLALLVASLAYGVLAADTPLPEKDARNAPPIDELTAVAGFVLLPFIGVVVAKTVTGAFVNRYVSSAVLGFAVLAGLGVAFAFRRSAAMRLVVAATVVAWFALSQTRELLQPTGFSLPVSRTSITRPTEWVAAVPNRTLPLVVADPHTFLVLSHYGSPEIKSRIVYLADPSLALKHLGHNSVERGMLDLVKPWFRLHVVPFDDFAAHHSRFLVYGDFVRLSFLNWMLPELRERGIRVEVLDRAGDNMLLAASRDGPVAEYFNGGHAPHTVPVR
jgi:Dolichyl-phosphate-mannose-protein mannosyltransferase